MEPAESSLPALRWQRVRDAGIGELRAGNQARARELLSEAAALNAQDVTTWLWLSGAVATPAEQRFCLERVLELQPGHPDAQRGLASLSQVMPQTPLLPTMPAVPSMSDTPPASSAFIVPQREGIASSLTTPLKPEQIDRIGREPLAP